MIELNIPGRGRIQIQHLVSDVNGTLAVDGQIISGVASRLTRLQDRLTIHLLTADTHGRQDEIDRQLGLVAERIPTGGEAEAKAQYVRTLGAEAVVALGQGANDAMMLKEAAIGICLLSDEGLAVQALTNADILVGDIHHALELLEKPMRLIASLRQ
jgi:P-type E1-E2 ATPase